MHNEMEIRFLSLSGNEGFARAAAAAFAAQMNPGIEELSDIRTAVSEAVTNAIIRQRLSSLRTWARSWRSAYSSTVPAAGNTMRGRNTP